MVQLERDLVFASGLDRMLEAEQMPIDLAIQFLFQPLGDIIRGDRAERLAGFAGLKNEGDFEFADAPRQFLGFVQFARFALGAFRLQHVESGAWRAA